VQGPGAMRSVAAITTPGLCTYNPLQYVIEKPTKIATFLKYSLAVIVTLLVAAIVSLYYLWQTEIKSHTKDREDYEQQIERMQENAEKLQTSLLIK
jgi:hypothetical protein